VTGKKPRSSVEAVLQGNVATRDLHILEKAGCNRNELITLLELAFLADESWETQIGMKLRDFKSAVTHIRDCANTIDRLNRSELIYRASIEHRLPGFIGLLEPPTLAERVREYANNLEWLRNVFGPKRSHRLHAWKAYIVAVVTEDTKKAHDLEVSSLIAAVLDNHTYSLDAHKTWRLKHPELIVEMRKILQDRRLVKRPFPSPPESPK
jgi:hypothetical protein